jgi:Glycosyl hydrolases family 28
LAMASELPALDSGRSSKNVEPAYGNAPGGKGESHLYNVADFGAAGDGKHSDAQAIQKAIDTCFAQGGGTVFLPKGDYLSTTLILKSNVTLHLAAGAHILATSNVEDYRPHGCILYAKDAHNITLVGQGVIDGRGEGVRGVCNSSTCDRYKIIHFERCRDIVIAGVMLKDSAFWCTHLSECKEIRIEGVKIHSFVNANNDGFDIDSCQNVFISNCHLHCGDDAIALKTNSTAPCMNIAITNCVLSTRWAAFRFGPESRGNFENIAVSNCAIHDTFGCGIKLQMNEGAQMKDIAFNNLVMENVTGPISLRLAKWVSGLIPREGNENRPVGIFRNVLFSNIRARVAANAQPEMYNAGKPFPGEEKSCISVTGLPGHPIEGITLSNIHITFPGGGTAQEAARRTVPDLPETYPEYFMFGVLPAYGFYGHHVKDLVFNNVRFDLASPDLRPAVVCDDAEGLDFSDFQAEGNEGSGSLLRLEQARRVFIHGSCSLNAVGAFLRVEGTGSHQIGLSGNDFRQTRRVLELREGAPSDAVESAGNLGGK